MKKFSDYMQPTSLTWWGGLFMVLIGVLGAENVSIPFLSAVTEIAGALAGDTSPATLIGSGLAFIGVRAKLERS